MQETPPPILNAIDLLVAPLFLVLILSIAYFWRERNVKYGSVVRRYFFPALLLRLILGSIGTAVMYQYYYGGGDTFSFFHGARITRMAFFQDPGLGMELLFEQVDNWSYDAQLFVDTFGYRNRQAYYFHGSTGTVLRIAAFFNLVAFNSYLAVSFIFTFYAFLGCWRLYEFFNSLYPRLHYSLAIAVLFIPSVVFWGTGIMKDSLTIGGLGFLTYAFYNLFIRRRRIALSIISIIINGLIIASVKIYVLVALGPALVGWMFLRYLVMIKDPTTRFLLTPVLVVAGLVGSLVAFQVIGSFSDRYSLDSIIDTAIDTQDWVSHASEVKDGSTYDLGQIDGSLGGMIQLFPKAVNVTLFRPYLWEASKFILVPAALESFLTLIATLFIFFKIGFFKTLSAIFRNPDLAFSFIFSILFAYAVGVSTGAFGALVRYKIPCLPFYFSALVILYYEYIPPRKKYSVAQDAQPPPAKIQEPMLNQAN